MSPVRSQIESILRDVLDQPDLNLAPGLRATEVEDWDSLAHISLMFSIESHFDISFTDHELGTLDDVDELVDLVESKVQANNP